MTRISLPWPHPKLSPNARVHHKAKWRISQGAKSDAYTLANNAGKPALSANGPIRVLWTLCPPDKRARDMDNAIAALKWHQDGVALAWGVNDARFVPTYQWADPVHGGCVHIEVLP